MNEYNEYLPNMNEYNEYLPNNNEYNEYLPNKNEYVLLEISPAITRSGSL